MKRRQRSTDMAKWRSASSSRSSVAGPGRALRSVLLRRMAALHCRGRTQPPATASNIGRRGRTGLQLAPDLDGRPGLPAHAHARGRTQARPAKPSTRHQPGTRRDAACGESFAQGPAAKAPKETSKPGPCSSTDNHKQDTRKCRAATRQGEDTATRKENRTVCLFQFLCL
jgi:hypothetical protein